MRNLLLIAVVALSTTGCGIIYKQPIYQGNLLQEKSVAQLQAGKAHHVAADVGVRPFVDGQAAGGVRREKQQGTVAAALLAAAGSGKSVADFRREALAFGAKMFACPTALASHGVDAAELISGLAGQAGAAAFIGRTLDPAWRSLSF